MLCSLFLPCIAIVFCESKGCAIVHFVIVGPLSLFVPYMNPIQFSSWSSTHHVLEECCSLPVCFSRRDQGRVFLYLNSQPPSERKALFVLSIRVNLPHGNLYNISRLMALTHTSSIYGHPYANYSTPSLSSISHSSRHDVTSLRHIFSSPLAECYARDKTSALRPPTGNDYISVKGDHKTAYCQQANLRSGTPPGAKFEHRSNVHSFKSDGRERSDFSNQKLSLPEPCTSLRSDCLRPLLSPISFTPLTDASEASDSTDSRFHDEYTDPPLRKNFHNTAATSIGTQDNNRCLFPVCKPEPIDVQDTTRAPMDRLDHSSPASKPRALSRGEGLQSKSSYERHVEEEPRDGPPRHVLHRTTGSRELRRSGGSQQVDRGCAPWVNQIIRATERAGSYQPYQASDIYGPPRHDRSRLWLEATKNEEMIEEAVSRFGICRIFTVLMNPMSANHDCYSKSDETQSDHNSQARLVRVPYKGRSVLLR